MGWSKAAIVLSLSFLGLAAMHSDDPPTGTYTSPSGEWRLEVSRPDKVWNGANELVLRRGEAEVWRGRHELGLRFVLVGDDGRCAGYGYTGEAEANASGTTDGPYGLTLRVFVFDPAGRALLDASHPRLGSSTRFAANPRARGAFLVQELGRFVLRVDDGTSRAEGTEEWWAFDLVSGSELFREHPEKRLGLKDGPLHDARAVPGTPLVLLQWQRVASRERSFEITDVYQLLRPDWTIAWAREFVNEKPRKPGQDFLSTGGRGTEFGPGRFVVHPPGGAGTFAFDVRRDGAGWSVSERAR